MVPQDLETARRYGALKAMLRRRGRPLPENDLRIAASALQHDLTLATLDRHSDSVEDPRIEAW